MRRVVVTGMGGVSSLGGSWPEIREALHAGRTGVKYIPAWDTLVDLGMKLGAPADWFAHDHVFPRQQMRSMGRVAALAVKAAQAALDQAGLSADPILKSGRVGVAAGSSAGSTEPTVDFFRFLESGKAGRLNATSYIRMMSHTAPVNLALFFGLTGRLVTTSSACTSGSQGIGAAFELIQADRADVMLAGGAEEFCPTMTMVFDRLYATSKKTETPQNAVRPFDRSRDGLVIGEGAGMLVLEERDHALARGARPLAEIVGYATNCDGSHISQPLEATQIRVMQLALESAGIDASAVGFISGHGTGTITGDVVESKATAAVYGATTPFHTLKGHFGHTLGACGALEAWLGVEMMAEGLLCATANLNEVDPKCAELDYVIGEPRPVDAEYFASNNFAFGGVNTSLVIRRAT